MSREMKDSGVEWIGEIPKNWNVQRVKNAFVRKKAEAHQENPVVLSLARAGVKVRDLSKNEGQIAESYYNYNLVEFGDLLLNPMDLYSGANCSISMVEGVISPAYINLRAKSGYSSRFYDYYFKTQYWSMAMFAHGKGVSFENRWTLGIEELFNYKIPVPLENEQDKIADFLDGQCEKINLAIEKAKVSIEEYRNLKQSFITQIVTKGINENDTMKESGIEWIGKIPASWKVTQLRHCASIRSGITLGKTYSKDTELVEMPYLRVANVQDGYVDTNDIAVLQVSKDEIEKYSLSAGEVLMTEGGDRDKLGRGCVWDGRITPCLHQNHIFAVKVKEKLLNPHYLEYLTASSVGRTYFDVTAVKTTNLACTSSSKVLAFTIPLPSIDEQNEIVDYLKEKCGCIENVIFKKEQFISELENYKKSLIYEYVTGKKEAAAKLRREMEETAKASREYKAQMDAQRQKVVEKAQAEARAILDEARDTADQVFKELNEMRRRQRKEEDWQRINDERAGLRHRLNEAEGKLGQRPEAPVPPPTRPAQKGDTVELVKMGTQATVLSVNKDGSLQLQAGILKITAKQDEVRVVEGESIKAAKKVVARAEHKLRSLGASPEIDLRGMMTDEAIGALDLFLDNAVLGKLNEVRIIHGKGTGAVRKAVREHLKRSRYVKSFRPGRYGEGEDGVTIAELR